MSAREAIDPRSSLWSWLAYDLWFQRTQRGLSLAQLGKIVRVTRGTVCNWEAGRDRPKDDHMQLLDDAWKTGGHFQRLLFFARTGHDPDWFKQYIQYEENASVIKIYDGKRVPALIQTEGYARALLATAGLEEAGEREAEARRHRREILKRRVIPYIWVLLDQEVLECLVGSPQIMREQLWHLIELSKHPRIVIRIVPREVGAHRGHDGAFQVQTVGTRDVAYVGAQIGGRLIEGGDEVRTLALWFDQIGACAWSKGASRELIERETRKYDDRVAQEFT